MEKRQLELLWDSKRADFCEHMLFVSKRFDRLLSKSILKELSPFLAACTDFLFDTYNLKTLRRLFFSHCRCAINRGGKKITICASEAKPDQSEAMRMSGANSKTIGPERALI